MSEYVYQYVELPSSPLVVEAIYKGGTNKNVSDDPISKLLKGTGNQGGFRKAVNPFGKVAYVVIYSSNKELAWPDYLDTESGVFRYYGDNRKPGSAIHETKRGGNLLLREVFDALHGNRLEDIPPFFIFEKADSGRDVRFRGLAVPGNPSIPSDRDLVAFWRTMDGKRFQNYEAYFTILDTGSELITREWIDGLLMGTSQAKDAAPKCWKEFLKKGRAGIKPLRSQRIDAVRKKRRRNLKRTTRERSATPYMISIPTIPMDLKLARRELSS